MRAPSPRPRLTDIVEAIGHIQAEMTGVALDAFEADWRRRWLLERGIENHLRGESAIARRAESTASGHSVA